VHARAVTGWVHTINWVGLVHTVNVVSAQNGYQTNVLGHLKLATLEKYR